MGAQERSRRARNVANAALAFAVAAPALLFHLAFLHHCPSNGDNALWSTICSWHPLTLVNLIFFLNVDLLFWIISLIQGSTWLIDPYWTIIPVMINYFYMTHPSAKFDKLRCSAVTSLVWVWSVRLTHSYFRREQWQWGESEDWRFSQLRAQHPRQWWWMSFFAAYLSQHVFLIGITLPLYGVHTTSAPWSLRDATAASLSLTGIVIAWFADTQLHLFMRQNAVLRELGAAPVPVLQEGMWRYSRHPNYFGEQLWWWGLAAFARSGWMAAGAAVNTACLAYVTVLVERTMVERESRAAAYRRYQECTSVWIPWRVSPSGKKKE